MRNYIQIELQHVDYNTVLEKSVASVNMVLVPRSRSDRHRSCVVVASVFLVIIQLMDKVSCFTHVDSLPPSILRNSRIHRPHHHQQQLLLHLMTPFPPTRKTTWIRTTISSSTTAAMNDKKSKEKRAFRLPTINTIEYNRIYRRVENTYKDHTYWVKHRSSSRLLHHIRTMPRSIIYQTIRQPVRYITYISTFVVVWNCLVLLAKATMATFDMPHHIAFLFGLLSKKLLLLQIPIDPLVITSPMLGLLLVFRTNSCYKRYEEALINWTKTKNQSRNIIRMAKSMRNMSVVPQPMSHHANLPIVLPQQEQQRSELVHLGLCLWVFARTMKRQLSHADDDEISYRNEIDNCYDLPALYRKQLISQVQHRPNCALQYLSEAIEDLSYIPNIRKNEMHTAVTTFEQCLGSNERILSSPVPLFYTRWTARFLFLWLAFSPFALYPHVINTAAFLSSIPTTSMLSMGQMLLRSFILVPMMYAISMFMFGIDEIAMQCEEPFSILPQQGYCNEIYNNCIEIANYNYYENDATAATPNAAIDERMEHAQSSIGGGGNNMDRAGVGRLPETNNDDTIQPDVTAQAQQRDSFKNKNAEQYLMGHSQ